jgi:CRISPR-associated protein Cas2
MRHRKKNPGARAVEHSPFKLMWLFVMFDLPVLTKQQRKTYAEFLRKLKGRGFDRLQLSVYARPCPSDENAQVHRARIERDIPEEGYVRMLMLTDKQFSRMQNFYGKKAGKPESQPDQLSFF